MYLSKLEIFGFKSFANKTVLNFTKGITGVVGPNGCGKTNIVDAIRWCLGEQKSSTLRSDKMENVIFNGTRSKKPMGMSEVSLTMINDTGTLPTEYSEVTITRRIFRSGESEYLLNKNICRLKDITNLFMDTGMGTNAYSVIELKMIETILSNRADERRHMFEEAAGVNKYKLRRRLSLKKLDDVKGDLTRVNDIVSEVEKTVRSLERQAKKADQYNKIQTVLREKELDLAERELCHFNRTKKESNERLSILKTQREEIDDEIRKIENELIIFRSKISNVEKELDIKRSEITTFTDKIHNTQKNISVAEERLNSLERNIEKYSEELEELQLQLEETEIQIVNYKEQIQKLITDIETKRIEVKNNESSFDEKQSAVEESKNILRNHTEDVLTKFRNLSNLENQLKSLNDNHSKINNNIDKLNDKIQNITSDIAKTVGYLEELSIEKTQVETKLHDSESLYSKKQKEKDELEKELSILKESELEEKSAFKELKNKIEFLKTLIANLEGVSSGSKALIENNEWTQNQKHLFADIGSTDNKFRFALEASLKSVLNNLLIEKIDDLQKAVSFLKKNDLGKASFYLLRKQDKQNKLLSKIFDYGLKRKLKKIAKENSFLNWSFSVIQTDVKWRPYFQNVLMKTAILSDLGSAIELSKKYPDFNFVTLEGDIVKSSGIIEAGSPPRLDDTLFGRKQLLDNLIDELPGFEDKLKKLRFEIEDKEEAISKINLKDLSDRGKLLLNDLNNIEKQISQLEFENKKASEEIDITQQEIHDLASESNRLDNEITKITAEIETQRNEKELAEEIKSQLENKVAEAENDFNSTVADLNSKKLEMERLHGQFQNAENAVVRAEKNKSNIIETSDKRESDIKKFKEEIDGIKLILEDSQIEYDEDYTSRQNLINHETEIVNNLNSIKEESSEYEKTLNKNRTERQEISEEIHNIDLRVKEVTLRIENLRENIMEDYALEIEEKEFDDLESFNFEETNKEVHSLKERLKTLGPINLLAYSEYEEEKERLDFLLKQREDLVQSEKDLIKTIHEINDTAQKLFLETFEQIRNHFRNIFQTLFNPGDEADLRLDENIDPLESKIEIMAKPKGKRPTSIELLSGGEKTLTATALLFAIYLVKPSPFCILDEVDAPLDDANIDRFTKLIREFSVNTQFIIVTHNKRTMEAAETMYGITMQEEGISKLVGVKFDEEIA